MTETLRDRLGAVAEPALPQHADVAEWRHPTADDIDALHSVHAAADAVDHPTWITPREDVADTFELSHIDHARDSIIGFAADGTPVAFGSAFFHPSRDERLTVNVFGAVHPGWRRRGIGSVLMPWIVARGLQQLAESGLDLPADLKAYAEAEDRDQIGLAERNGFAAERWFTTMERDMVRAVPHRAEPDGIRIVTYTPDRALDALAARNDAFRDHWGSLPSTEEGWRKFVDGEFFRPDLSHLALDADGRIVAFCLASVNEDDWESLGATNSYIDLIGVVRSHRGRGLAPLVISRTLEAIAAVPLERAVLDVDTASPTGANTLYERLGFAATEREVALVRQI